MYKANYFSCDFGDNEQAFLVIYSHLGCLYDDAQRFVLRL